MKTRLVAVIGVLAVALGHTVRLGRAVLPYLPGWAGAALVSTGAGMAYLPAGVIVGGVFLLAADALIPRPARPQGGV